MNASVAIQDQIKTIEVSALIIISCTCIAFVFLNTFLYILRKRKNWLVWKKFNWSWDGGPVLIVRTEILHLFINKSHECICCYTRSDKNYRSISINNNILYMYSLCLSCLYEISVQNKRFFYGGPVLIVRTEILHLFIIWPQGCS
jgi:hypothetical protein